jgi:hypothetical protein
VSVATSCEGVSTESPVLGDRQIVTSFLLSINQSSSSSFLPSINSDSNAATPCSCTSSHSLLCPVPLSKRVSLYFTSPSRVLPRNQCSFNVEYVMSQRMTTLSNAADTQKQLINVGINMSRATCSLKPDVWSSLLVDYVPSDSCYTSEALVAGMKYGSYTRYEGDRTESVSCKEATCFNT